MQQFVVPQFIDVEDKIIGPITVRQFLILLSAGAIGFLAYSLFQVYLFLTITVIVSLIAIAFAFIKVRGQTFHYFMLNVVQYIRKPALRVWQKRWTDEELNFFRTMDTETEVVEQVLQKQPQRSHIRQLSLQVNTGGYYQATDTPDMNLPSQQR